MDRPKIVPGLVLNWVGYANSLEEENARLKAELNAWVKGDRWLDNGDVMATTPLGALEAE
jgi:hypothetical protein